jgi:hypothetical protein
MSYLIKTNNTSPFVSVKLTEKGRESLSKGELDFAFWAIGDSELNYDREFIVDNNSSDPVLSKTSNILRPFDRQPDIKSYITTSQNEPLNTITSANLSVVKAVVNNKATERGFFSGSSSVYNTLTGSPYTLEYTNPLNTTISGGTYLYIPTGATISSGDFVRLKLTNDNVIVNGLENTNALPNLWYGVVDTLQIGNELRLELDRPIPNISGNTSSNSYIFVYKGGEVYSSFGEDFSSAYWDTGTLSFNSSVNVTCDDVKVWNMNNIWCENLAGMSASTIYEDYTRFGSYDYLGLKYPYTEYLCSSDDQVLFECNGAGYSYPDSVVKSISVLHYTNNVISNVYGEFLYINNNTNQHIRITIPDIMYHRRNFATTLGTDMGMSFVSSGDSKIIAGTDIEYYDFYEDPLMISSTTPRSVGKVFPQLKIVVIHDDEIIAALSYKSNRNWTLPSLSGILSSPTGGPTTGVLPVNQTIYLSYILDNENSTGLTKTLPCQKYVKITNTSSSSKDVTFNLEDLDLFPYMRKIEDITYDGLGFYATNFKLIYQIVSDTNTRPDSGSWKVVDFTTTGLTTTTGQTINPLQLESQSNNFVLTSLLDIGATTLDIYTPLNLPLVSQPDNLQFGDERFFYGNLDTYIGATIYKTIFDIRVDASQFNVTTNPTRSTDPTITQSDIKISEVGIYDSNKELVVIGKLSTPVNLHNNTIMLELSMDF